MRGKVWPWAVKARRRIRTHVTVSPCRDVAQVALISRRRSKEDLKKIRGIRFWRLPLGLRQMSNARPRPPLVGGTTALTSEETRPCVLDATARRVTWIRAKKGAEGGTSGKGCSLLRALRGTMAVPRGPDPAGVFILEKGGRHCPRQPSSLSLPDL